MYWLLVLLLIYKHFAHLRNSVSNIYDTGVDHTVDRGMDVPTFRVGWHMLCPHTSGCGEMADPAIQMCCRVHG